MEPISDERLKELVARVLNYDEVSGGAVIDSTVRAAHDVESHFIAMELLAARARIASLTQSLEQREQVDRGDCCVYCDGSGTDHKHGEGRAHGDCCAMHGIVLIEAGKAAHEWVRECYEGKNRTIASLTEKYAACEQRCRELERQDGRV